MTLIIILTAPNSSTMELEQLEKIRPQLAAHVVIIPREHPPEGLVQRLVSHGETVLQSTLPEFLARPHVLA